MRKPDGDGSTPAPRLSLVYERREEARAAVAAAQPVGSVVLHGVPRSCACALLLLLPVLVSVCLLLLLLVRLRARMVCVALTVTAGPAGATPATGGLRQQWHGRAGQ